MIALFCIGRRWADGRVGVVLERAGEHVDPEHWTRVSAERLRQAREEADARQRQYAMEEGTGMWRRRDMDEHGAFDALEQSRV